MPDVSLFDAEDIPEFYGPGPAGNHLPQYAARKELWQYALSLVDDPSRHWCEFGVGEGESLDWFASRKPRGNRLFAFDSFEGIPEPWLVYPAGHWKAKVYAPNRPDVVVVPGLFDVSLAPEVIQEVGPVGMAHVDCDLYASTRVVLERIGPLLQPGSILVFDEFYSYFGWRDHEYKAFMECVAEHRLEFEYLGRTPTCQVAVRILGRGRSVGATVRRCAWTPTTSGVGIRLGTE